MKHKLLTIILLFTNFLSANQYEDLDEPEVSHEEVIKTLSKYNNYPYKSSPLYHAIDIEDFASALILIEYTENINKTDNHCSPLELLFKNAKKKNLKKLSDLQVKVAKKLIKYGANIHFDSKTKHSPLASACHFNLVDVAIELLDRGVNINECNGAVLSGAIYSENLDLIHLIIKRGADVNLSNPLAYAILKKNHEIIDILISSGAYFKHLFEGKMLVSAIRTPDVEIISLLLFHGANPNATDHHTPMSKKSILEVAIKTHKLCKEQDKQALSQIIDLLIQYGAKI